MSNSEKNVNPKLGERLKSLLKEKKKNQAWLASEMHISRSSICYWVNGTKTPHKDHIEELAKKLDCSPAYLLGYTDYRTIDDDIKATTKRAEENLKTQQKQKEKIMDAVLMSYGLYDDPISKEEFVLMKKKKPLSVIGRLRKHEVDLLKDALYDMVFFYVEHFITQHPFALLEEWKKDTE